MRGGYYEDFHNHPGKCTQIPANSGIYSPANDKGYSECSDSVTLPSHAHWKHSAGIDSSAGCTWDCNTGYKLNSGNTGCDIKETLTRIALEANDLTDISNNQKAVKTSVTNLQFAITDSDVSWWYVTHTPPTTFSPKGKKTTDSTARETSRSWTNTKPTTYAMSNFDTEGEHRLYVWVADAAQQVKLDSVQSDPFIVDTSPPADLTLSSKPIGEEPPGTTTASFTFRASDTTDITYYYCTDSSKCVPETEVTSSPLSLSGLSDGKHHLRYKAVDELGRSTSPQKYTWRILKCALGSVETKIINKGTKERTCNQKRSDWEPFVLATCEGGYWKGETPNLKKCVHVTGKFVSAEGTIEQTACTVQQVPNSSKTSCKDCGKDTHTEDNMECISNFRYCPGEKSGSSLQASKLVAITEVWVADENHENGKGGDWDKKCHITDCKLAYTKEIVKTDKSEAYHNRCHKTARSCEGGQKGLVYYKAGTNGEYEKSCQLNSCPSEHTLYDNNCYLNKIDCDLKELAVIKGTQPHATKATKDYTLDEKEVGAYDACEITACKAGYKVDQGVCAKPNTGYYVDGDGNEMECTSITEGTWTANPNTGLDSDECPFTCNAGYKKAGRACDKPDLGKYINSDGDAVSCNPITNGEFTENSGGLDSDTCPFTCKLGYVKNGQGRTCNIPSTKGRYADNGVEKECIADGGLTLPQVASWVSPAGGRTKDKSCNFTCPSETQKVNKLINGSLARSCEAPNEGEYIDNNGIKRSCGGATKLAQRGGSTWASNQPEVRTAAACKLASCTDTNKALNTAKTACDCVPSHHPDGINCVSNTRDCNPAPNNGQGKQVWGGTAWRTCQITHCDEGHWKSGGACVAVTGRYVSPDNNMARTACAGSEIPNTSKTACTNCLNDQHTENNISCTSNIHTGSTCKTGNLPSQASQTTAVKQTWSGGSWGACEATACKNGYAVSNGVCTATLCVPGRTQLVIISGG